MKLFSRLSLTIISLTVLFNVTSVTEAKAQFLNEILKRMDAHQKSLSSLRAKITMEKYDPVIRKRDVHEGTAIYSRRDKNQIWVKVDGTKPPLESMSFVNGQYVLFRPRLNMAIVGKTDKTKENAKFYDALSFLKMSRKEIIANYNINYLGTEKVEGEIETLHLVFTPKKSTIYKLAELWVESNGMSIQTKVFGNNNDSTTVLLSDLKKNEVIKAALFQINLPKGTKLIKDSGGVCPCFKPDNSNDALKYWSDAVFSGKVITVDGADYTFKAERTWKGIDSNEAVVRSFSTEDH